MPYKPARAMAVAFAAALGATPAAAQEKSLAEYADELRDNVVVEDDSVTQTIKANAAEWAGGVELVRMQYDFAYNMGCKQLYVLDLREKPVKVIVSSVSCVPLATFPRDKVERARAWAKEANGATRRFKFTEPRP